MARFVSWFSSKHGKLFTRSCVGLAAVSAFSCQIVANGPYLEKFKDIFQLYDFGKEKPISPTVNQIIQDVLKDCKLTEEEKKKIKFFNVTGHDLFNAGGTNSPWGALIGVPFTYNKTEDINFGELRVVGTESIDWIIDGADLLDALTLSDRAKKFGLMREIYSCNFKNIFENSVLAGFCVIFPAEFIRKINIQRDAFNKVPFKRRINFYLICYGLCFFIYQCLNNPVKHLRDLEGDKLAAETSSDYLDGGIEFYEKALLKNKSMRDLLGARGARMFDEKGNEKFILFAPRMPVARRLKNLKEMKENHQK